MIRALPTLLHQWIRGRRTARVRDRQFGRYLATVALGVILGARASHGAAASADYGVAPSTLDSGGAQTSAHYASVSSLESIAEMNLAAADYSVADGYVAALSDYLGGRVWGTFVFYNHSAWDGNDATANAADDNAIAPDKTPLLPGGVASFANYTSYSRGLNGIMVDIPVLPGTPSLPDFSFKVGNDNVPSAWPSAPSPSTITVRPGAGTGGADRVSLVWSDKAIQKQWLEVTVLATRNTGLAAPFTFYFGNAVGETGDVAGSGDVLINDALRIFHHLIVNVSLTNVYDIDRDGSVLVNDGLIAIHNLVAGGEALQWINLSGVGLSALSPNQAIGSDTQAADVGPAQSSDSVRMFALRAGSSGTLVLGWQTPSGANFHLQTTTELDGQPWTDLEIPIAVGPGGTMRAVIALDAEAEHRFYRLVVGGVGLRSSTAQP